MKAVSAISRDASTDKNLRHGAPHIGLSGTVLDFLGTFKARAALRDKRCSNAGKWEVGGNPVQGHLRAQRTEGALQERSIRMNRTLMMRMTKWPTGPSCSCCYARVNCGTGGQAR